MRFLSVVAFTISAVAGQSHITSAPPDITNTAYAHWSSVTAEVGSKASAAYHLLARSANSLASEISPNDDDVDLDKLDLENDIDHGNLAARDPSYGKLQRKFRERNPHSQTADDGKTVAAHTVTIIQSVPAQSTRSGAYGHFRHRHGGTEIHTALETKDRTFT